MAKQVLLKVFSGPHVGAEIVLGEGAHSIGRGDSCDVILDDQLIDEHHATLMVGEQTQLVAAPKSSVVIDGQQIDQSVLESFEFFTIGNTHLAVGPASGSWPKMNFPDYQLAQPVAAEETEENEGGTTESETEQCEEDSKDSTNLRPQMTKAISMIIMMLILFVIAGFGNAMFPAEASQTIENEISTADLEQIVQQVTPHARIKIQQREGFLFAEGFTTTKSDQRKIEQELTAADPSIQTRIRNTEALATATASILRMHKLDLESTPGSAGEVIVTGKASDDDVWSKAQKRIQRDVPLQTLTDKVVLSDEAVEPKANEYAPETALVEKTTKASVAKANASKPMVPKAHPAKKMPEAKVTLDVKSVSLGNRRVVTLTNGQRLFVGGNVQGHVVAAIELDHVILEKNGNRNTVQFGS